jgi:hypothetical protein
MRDHIKILGILNIVMGSLTAFAGLIVLLIMGGIAGFMASGIPDASSSDSESAKAFAPWMGLIGVGIAIFLVALAVPSIIGGWGLLKYKSWSRILMIIISGLNLLHIPLGTALGVYGLWVLLNDQATQLLESGGTLPPQTFPMQQPQSASFPGTQRPPGA